MGRTYSQCLLKQEDGLSLPSIENSNERKRKAVYCQDITTPASTKRVLLSCSSELPSSSRGRPSINNSVEATRFYYKEVARENDVAKSRLQEELKAAQEELVSVKEKCKQLRKNVRTLESDRRRSNKLKQNEVVTYRSNDPYSASNAFLKNLSAKEGIENADVVAGVVRALSKKKSRSMYFKQCRSTYQKLDHNLKSNCTSNCAKSSCRGSA
jgi:septal ring factor EnvC (AmiA/AmiB activator)